MIRVAVSLKTGLARRRFVKRLVNASRADRLSKALTELGRLVMTIYILHYIQDKHPLHIAA